MNKTDGFCMARLDPDTHARLKAFAKRLDANRKRGQGARNPWLDGPRVSLTDAIRELLFREDTHAARSRTTNLARQQRKR